MSAPRSIVGRELTVTTILSVAEQLLQNCDAVSLDQVAPLMVPLFPLLDISVNVEPLPSLKL